METAKRTIIAVCAALTAAFAFPALAQKNTCYADFLFTVGEGSDRKVLYDFVFSNKVVIKSGECKEIEIKNSLFPASFQINQKHVALAVRCEDPHKDVYRAMTEILLNISNPPAGITDPITQSSATSSCTGCVRVLCMRDSTYYCVKDRTKPCTPVACP